MNNFLQQRKKIVTIICCTLICLCILIIIKLRSPSDKSNSSVSDSTHNFSTSSPFPDVQNEEDVQSDSITDAQVESETQKDSETDSQKSDENEIVHNGYRGEVYYHGAAETYKTNVLDVRLNKIHTELTIGSTEKLYFYISPSTATNQSVTFSSSNKKVASVDQNGKVTAVSSGTAAIRCISKDGNKLAACIVAVSEKENTYPILNSEKGVVDKKYPYGNVLRYGADATGNTESTTAFSNCQASGDMLIPVGNFLISTVKLSSNRTVVGESITDTELQFAFVTKENYEDRMFDYDGKQNVTMYNINVNFMMDDGTIPGWRQAGVLFCYARDTKDLYFSNVHISNAGMGSFSYGRTNNMYCSNCVLSEIDCGFCNFNDYGGSNIRIDNCSFIGTQWSEPVVIDGVDDFSVTNCFFARKYSGNGISIEGSRKGLIKNNYFYDMGACTYIIQRPRDDKAVSENIEICNNTSHKSRYVDFYVEDTGLNINLHDNKILSSGSMKEKTTDSKLPAEFK